MKTLHDVVTTIVNELSAANAPFSAHDVTVEARKHVNNSTDVFALARGSVKLADGPHGTVQGWLVEHDDVKTIIQGMFDRNELTRQFAGSFYQYQSTVAQPLALTPLKTTMTNRMGFIVLVHSIIAENLNVCSLDDMVADIDANIALPNFLSKYGLDSLDVIEFIMSLEEYLNIDISDEDFQGLKNVDEVILMLADKFRADPTADLYDTLKDIIEPLQSVVYPTANPIAQGPAIISTVNSNITSQDIVDYLTRANNRHNRNIPRSVKHIQSTIRTKGTRSKDLVTIIEADKRLRFTKQGKTYAETFVEIA